MSDLTFNEWLEKEAYMSREEYSLLPKADKQQLRKEYEDYCNQGE